jgi:integrase
MLAMLFVIPAKVEIQTWSQSLWTPAFAGVTGQLNGHFIEWNGTWNQAMNALVFLYKRVLRQSMEEASNAVRAGKKVNVPVVLKRDEVAAAIMSTPAWSTRRSRWLCGAWVWPGRSAPMRFAIMSSTDIRTIQALLGQNDVATTMIYTHILQQGGHGVPSPLDDLGVWSVVSFLPADME